VPELADDSPRGTSRLLQFKPTTLINFLKEKRMTLNDTQLSDIARMLVIYTHVISCCIAIGFAFFADFRILKANGNLRNRDIEIVQQVAQFVAIALGALWASGIAILLIDFGYIPSLNEVFEKPKLAAKLSVVIALTMNGFLLHFYALPRLQRLNFFASLIGGVSASSWLFAAFVGIAKPLATILNYNQFMALYVLVLTAGLVGAASVFVSQKKKASPNLDWEHTRPALHMFSPR
jgi:hypothetical protein